MDDKIKDGGPAFPVSTSEASAGHQDGPNTWQFPAMTLRQYTAIKLRIPNSGTDWLDEMIRQSVRGELAAKAMQTLISADKGREICHDWAIYGTEPIDDDSVVHAYATLSYGMADAMLKAQEAA